MTMMPMLISNNNHCNDALTSIQMLSEEIFNFRVLMIDYEFYKDLMMNKLLYLLATVTSRIYCL